MKKKKMKKRETSTTRLYQESANPLRIESGGLFQKKKKQQKNNKNNLFLDIIRPIPKHAFNGKQMRKRMLALRDKLAYTFETHTSDVKRT